MNNPEKRATQGTNNVNKTRSLPQTTRCKLVIGNEATAKINTHRSIFILSYIIILIEFVFAIKTALMDLWKYDIFIL